MKVLEERAVDKCQNTPGWGVYICIRDKRKYAFKHYLSDCISKKLVEPSKLPVIREYYDAISIDGNRPNFYQMLEDAENGYFSHLGLYKMNYFGLRTIEGLQTANRLIRAGVKIRIVELPDILPEEPDGFFGLVIQLGLVERDFHRTYIPF